LQNAVLLPLLLLYFNVYPLNPTSMPTALTKSFAFLLSLFAVITVSAQNPLAPALGFQIFSESNIQMKGGTIEGALAAGGNFEVAGNAQYNGGNSSGIGRSYVTIGANTYALIANGNYVATSGNFLVNSSNRWIKFGNLNGAVSGTNNFNQLRVTRNNVYVHVNNTRQVFSQVAGTGLVDFTTAFNNLRATASGLAACANTGVSISNIGTIARINLSNGKNVWNLTGTQLNNISILSFSSSPSASRPLIINVNAAGSYTLKMPTFSGISISQAPYIVFNFYNATSITYTGSNAYGSILATNAAFIKTGSQTIAGQVISKSYSQSAGNLQYAPFNTNAVVCVTCIKPNVTMRNLICWLPLHQLAQQDNGRL
jgi:choice-of-anchor A domain-containing protein